MASFSDGQGVSGGGRSEHDATKGDDARRRVQAGFFHPRDRFVAEKPMRPIRELSGARHNTQYPAKSRPTRRPQHAAEPTSNPGAKGASWKQ